MLRLLSHRYPTGSVKYRIIQSGDSVEEIRKRADAALQKQCMSWSLPEGVSVQKMAELWEAMDFGGLSASKSVFPQDLFREPYKAVRNLREMARQGREESQNDELKYAGMKKVVWGQTDIEDISNADLARNAPYRTEEDQKPAEIEELHRTFSEVTSLDAEVNPDQ